MLLKDVVAAVQEIRKDLAYTQDLEAKWEKEADRFPVLFEYIKKQSEFFKEEIERVLSLNISNSAISDFVKTKSATAQIARSEGEPQASAVASPAQPLAAEERSSGRKRSGKKSGDKRSAPRTNPRKRGRKGPGEMKGQDSS